MDITAGYTPLNEIIARGERKVPPRVVYTVMQPLIEALIDARDTDVFKGTRQLKPSLVLVSDKGHEVLLIDVNARDPYLMKRYGELLLKTLKNSKLHDKSLSRLAQDCIDGTVTTLEEAHLRVEKRVSASIYRMILRLIVLCLIIMAIIRFLL